MDTPSAFLALLKVLGAPAITVIGFGWMLFWLKKLETELKADVSGLRAEVKADIAGVKADVSELRAELKADVSGLRAELKADIANLDAKFSLGMTELKSDVKSIKSNHLPHIEAAIKALSKGTPNEEHVKAILDLSHESDIV
jgi:hypothetical protein